MNDTSVLSPYITGTSLYPLFISYRISAFKAFPEHY